MRNIFKKIVIAYVVVSAFLLGYLFLNLHQNDQYQVVNLIADASPDQMKLFTKMGTDWLKDARLYSINEYKIAIPNSPSNSPQNDIYLWRKDNLFLTSIDGIGTQIYDAETQFDISKYVANLQDRDNDGKYDSIAYAIIDKKNDKTTEIIDRNFDGNLDFKTERSPNDYKFYNSLGTKWELKESR